MDFTFSEDQLLFQESVRDFLANEVTPATIRELWESDTGRSDALWAQLTEMGLVGMTVPEEFGGLGMTALDFVLLAQECGYVALPEPLVHTVLVAVPLLNDIGGELAAQWLPRIAAGEARVNVGLEENQLVEDAHVADLLLLQRGDNFHALAPVDVKLRHNESVDPSRKLYSVEFDADTASVISSDAALVTATLNRGALACAAQALGLSQRMVDLSVQYSSERQQFGKAIKRDPLVLQNLQKLGLLYEFYGKYEESLVAYQMLLRLNPDYPGVHAYRARTRLACTRVAISAIWNCTA